MVQILLQIKADLENITNFQPQGGCDDPDFSYYFKVKCGNCGEVSQKETCVTLSELVDVPKSRGSAHLVQKCKFCGRDGTIVMIPGRGRPYTVEDSEAQKFVPLMAFDCRGFEPVDFSFKDGWVAESGLRRLLLFGSFDGFYEDMMAPCLRPWPPRGLDGCVEGMFFYGNGICKDLMALSLLDWHLRGFNTSVSAFMVLDNLVFALMASDIFVSALMASDSQLKASARAAVALFLGQWHLRLFFSAVDGVFNCFTSSWGSASLSLRARV